MNSKIGILIVYFGDCPDFIRLFLHSCKFQTGIDFIFFTDWTWDGLECSSNIVKYNSNLFEFNSLATRKIGIDIDIKNGYKLCDLKPAWTHIYEDYLKEYAFIGYCDVDLFFGDIRKFFNEDIISSVDMFTITQNYLSGALTLLKNNEKMRTLYREAKGWEYMFADSRHFAFDEYLRVNPSDCEVESFSDLVFRKEKDGVIIVQHSEYIGYEKRPYSKVSFIDGRVIAEGREWIFYHYVVAKQYVLWVLPNWMKIPNRFYVNKYGFYKDRLKPLKGYALFFRRYYRKQMKMSMKRKMKTFKDLLKSMKIKNICMAIIKQIRK